MKIAIIGPTHPYKGGIAQHTTELAHQLTAAGHEVRIVSWKKMYPFFYPGKQYVPDDEPELPLFSQTDRVLSWRNPVGWRKWAASLRDYDEVIFVWWVPAIQGPVYWQMLRALGEKGPHSVILCHNVSQHSASPVDRQFTHRVFEHADQVLVHTKALADIADNLTATPITIAAMPAHLPGGEPTVKPKHTALRNHLLFFGLVRQYKGVDVLIEALAKVPNVTLTIAGEMWGKQEAKLTALIQELKISDRVTLRSGYVPAKDIAGLFSAADALVLPYRSGTATQNVELAFAHGIPVIATHVGSMPLHITDGVDGLLCKPESITDLAKTIKRFYSGSTALKLTKAVPPSHSELEWQHYIDAITTWPRKR